MDSEMSTPRVGQTPRAPISLEGERRKAMKLVYSMERDVEAFRDKWLFNETDESVDEWIEFTNLVKGRSGPFRNYVDFGKELTVVKEDKGYLGSRILLISQLQRVCDRAKAFEGFFESCYQRIEDALIHYMSKYCHSYFAELEELDVDCVREYENNISEWQAEIKAYLKEAEETMENLRESEGMMFTDYLGSYGQVLQYMNMSLDAFSCVCDPFRSWVSADEGYLKKVSIEMECLQRNRQRITETLRKCKCHIEETKSKELRNSFNNKILGRQVQGTVLNRRFCRNREYSFVDKIEMSENILHEKKLELSEATNKLYSRPLHTLVREPSDGMKDKTARLQQEVNKLEKRVQNMKRGKRDMRETRYNLQKEYHHLKGTYEKNVKFAQRQTEGYHGKQQDIRDLQDELKTIERKLHALKRIIYVKSHPATVKKIFFQGYATGEKLDYRGRKANLMTEKADTLQEAIDVAAAGVGKDWDKMYQNLPFNPPRDPNKRLKDIDLMDMDFRSVHPPSEKMALRSLDKWKSLSKVTSVNALVRTLKTIKKNEVAKKIEKQILTVVN